MMKTLGILTVVAALSPLTAAAQQSMFPPPGAQAPFYFGAGIGSGHLKMSGNDIPGLNNAQIDNDNARKGYYLALRSYWENYFELRKLTLYDFKENQLLIFDIREVM